MIGPRPASAPDQLSDLLRTCIQCGLCLPHCATWLATGNEVHSPRGRLLLLQEVLGGATDPIRQASLAAFDQCIGCRACETACPSGVPFSLLQEGMALAMAAAGRPTGLAPQPAVPAAVLRRLDSSAWLRGLGLGARFARAALRLAAGPRWRRRLATAPLGLGRVVRLLATMPSAPAGDRALTALLDRLIGDRTAGRVPAPAPSPPPSAPTVLFFAGCANAGLLPAVSRRLREVLRCCGCMVVTPPDQACCGALAAHTGRPQRAADLQRTNRRAFGAAAVTAGPEVWTVVEASGCGAALKEGGQRLGGEVLDATEALGRLDLPIGRPVPLKVAFHDPCHLQHGQGIRLDPRLILRRIPGLTLVEPAEAEVCCGSGGAWGLRYRQLSEALGRRKAANLAATGADLIVTTNPGCLGQIAAGMAALDAPAPILPLTDLVWYACGGGPE